jgi:hypothetical protein
MPKYRILSPVAYGGRRERGEIVEAPEGTFSEENAALVDGEKAPEQEEEEGEEAERLPAEDVDDGMLKDELQQQADLRGLSTTGTKTELVDRITLHDQEE